MERKNKLLVGELIDLLEPYRGKGDEITIKDHFGSVYRIRSVYRDDTYAVRIEAEYIE